MANVLKREKKEQILALGRLGWSLRQIEESTGISRATARRHLQKHGIAIRSARSRHLRVAGEDPSVSKAASSSEVHTDSLPVTAEKSASKSQCADFASLIESGLTLGRNATGIYQDLVDDHGYAGSYWSVLRFVNQLRDGNPKEAHPVIITSPGEEGQVDYGTGPLVRDPISGKYRRTRLFVFTLGFSRKSVRLLTFRSSSRIWAELHAQAFQRLGGAPRHVVLDNLKEGVIKADLYAPKCNPLYEDVLAHYGACAIPCRVRHPNRKGKVESGIGHTQATPLRGKRFDSLQEAQSYLDAWDEKWADTRIHGTTKKQVSAMFAEEKPHLLPLPQEPFRFYEFGTRTVHLDGCVEIGSAYYSVPLGWIGKPVFCQWNQTSVRILCPKTRALLREHLRQVKGRHRIDPADRSPKTPRGTLYQLERAKKAGPHIGLLCEQLIKQAPDTGIRRVLGILSLCKKHGAILVDKSCETAIDVGSFDYHFVKRVVDRGVKEAPLALKQIDPLIRQLSVYRDFVLQTQTYEEEERGEKII